MRYGFCTGFATDPLFFIDSSMEEYVSSLGFDYIEYPLMSVAALSEPEFTALRERLASAGLACDCACNLFPASVPVIGSTADSEKIRAYLDLAFARADTLGVKKLIFGSAGARKRGDLPREEADRQFLAVLELLEEYCGKHDMQVLIEAIRKGEADYINTLAEAAALVLSAEQRGCTHIALMADLYHMESNGESITSLEKHLSLIRHIHLCEAERALPAEEFSGYLKDALDILRKGGYNGTISYESVAPASPFAGKAACALLKNSIK